MGIAGKSQINVGLIGFGTIGAGTVRLLLEHGDDISKKSGLRIELARICDLDITTERPVKVDRSLLTTDASDVLDDPDIDIVIELIGGVGVARDFTLRAINNGKSVVTANKELVAKSGPEIFARARQRDVDYCFEASVGGGIPIIKPLRTSLAANRIQEVIGIVNGTTNYILTKMANEGRDFDEVLAEAQKAGYAEPDPTNDIEGYDAKYKIAILASVAFDAPVSIDHVYAEGITKISRRDIEYAKELGYVVKLLAIARTDDRKVQARVHPTFVPMGHPLASVNDVYNAIYVRGDFVQDVMFYGRGAGPGPTASAVIGDVMSIARNITRGATGRLPFPSGEPKVMQGIEDIEARYYIRMLVADRPGVLAAIARVFGDNCVSLASVVQKDTSGDNAEIVWITHDVVERNLRKAIAAIAHLPEVAEVSNWIRVV